MGFVPDQLATGRELRVLTIVDTFSRSSPALEPRFTFRGADVVEVLERVGREIGLPSSIRVETPIPGNVGLSPGARAARAREEGFSQLRLAGFYRVAGVGLVTPLHDGMNLVAKEYVAAQNPIDPGVLVQ